MRREAKMALTGNWELETGNWELETGNWELETDLQPERRGEARGDLAVHVGPEPGRTLQANTTWGLGKPCWKAVHARPGGYPAVANQLLLQGQRPPDQFL